MTQIASPPSVDVSQSRRRSHGEAVAWGAVIALAVVLLPLNAWWLWRDLSPIPERGEVQTMLGARRYPEAMDALRERLRRSPHDGESLMQLARALAAMQRFVESAEALHQVPEWWPAKAEAAFLEGETFKLLNRMREAEAAWRRCVASDPLHATPVKYEVDANQELLELFATEDRWDDAHAIIWNAYEHAQRSDYPAILIMWLRTKLERISPAAAVETLRAYVAADPNDWQARLALARAAEAIGRSDEASAAIQACLAAKPDDPAVWREHLAILHAQGDLAALIGAIKALPSTTESDAETWKYRAFAAEKSEDWERAVAAYRKTVALAPDEAEYHYKLAMAEERLGHVEAAREQRRRNQALRAARGRLTEAYQDYLAVDNPAHSGGPSRREAIERLAGVCDELGWHRVAEGWRKLVE